MMYVRGILLASMRNTQRHTNEVAYLDVRPDDERRRDCAGWTANSRSLRSRAEFNADWTGLDTTARVSCTSRPTADRCPPHVNHSAPRRLIGCARRGDVTGLLGLLLLNPVTSSPAE